MNNGIWSDKYADLVFYNGEVITVNQAYEIHHAVAVKGNKIVYIGNNSGADGLIGSNTQLIDLHGRSLLPGFIDSHLHIMETGMNELGINCSFPEVTSIEEIKSKIKKAASVLPPGVWIKGWGYDHTRLKEMKHPDRWDLDEATTTHPVVISRVCGHMVTCNSRALEISGINENTADSKGGKIERFDGKPTGLLYESASAKVKNKPYTQDELMEGLKFADRKLSRMGVTSVHDAGGYGALQNRIIQEAVAGDKINTRIYIMALSLPQNKGSHEGFLNAGIGKDVGNSKLKFGAFKAAFIDGSSSAPTAAVKEPYRSNPADRGMINITQDELNDLCLKAHKVGCQVTAHAVGDQAIEMFLNAIELAQKTYPKKNCRHRIEHCAIIDLKILERIKKMGIIPVSQPAFLYYFGDGYIQNYGSRTDYMFACRSYKESGIISAASSDCPVSSPDPLIGIHTAVNRESMEGKIVGSKQKVNIMDAIRMYTINGAYASFEEHVKGSLEVGKLADMVVLSEPIMKSTLDKIKNIKVHTTVIDGKITYCRK